MVERTRDPILPARHREPSHTREPSKSARARVWSESELRAASGGAASQPLAGVVGTGMGRAMVGAVTREAEFTSGVRLVRDGPCGPGLLALRDWDPARSEALATTPSQVLLVHLLEQLRFTQRVTDVL